MNRRRTVFRGEAAIRQGKISWLLGLVFGFPIWSPLQLASAGELKALNEQVADTYGAYRSAMFYLRTGNTDVAYLDLDTSITSWQSVVERFGKSPPVAFADDTRFHETLVSVQTALESGRTLLDKNDQTSAVTMLTSVRAELAALRSRNGIRVYRDCIDEMNAAMDRLWTHRHEPPDFADPDDVNAVKRDAAITDYLYRRRYESASAEDQSDDAFKRMFEGSLLSLPLIFDALDQGNKAMLINLLRELRSFDHMIWLEFG
ncbi:MAG: hypothetical protein AAGA73_06955 [Pseudomonadota bacterium]